MHERAGSPSNRIVQAPQTPCSQPTCVPVSPRSWRRKVAEKQSRLDVALVAHAVDGDGHDHRTPGLAQLESQQ